MGLSVELDQSVYQRSAHVYATVTVSNRGPTTAERVAVECDPTPAPGSNDMVTSLAADEDEIRLDIHHASETPVLRPGESFGGTASGVVSPETYNVGVVAAICTLSSANGPQVTAQASAPVTGVSNVVSGPYTLAVEPPAGYVPNDAGRVIDVLVTGEDVRWSARLTITTEDSATTCLSRG